MQVLRLPAVVAKTGYSRNSIYRLIAEGRFPKPIKILGKRAAGWIESEVDAVIQKAIDLRDGKEAGK
jgi:prophage regulatory protein